LEFVFVNSLSLVTTLLLVFSAAVSGAVLAHLTKLPMFVGYILMGLLAGTIAPNVYDRPLVEMASEVGITLLLFTLGLEFSFHRLARSIRTVLWIAVCQISVVFAVVFFLLFVFGWELVPALFFGAIASLSSTAIVMRLLTERGELESNHGDALAGWLFIQDLAVIPLVILLLAVSQSFLSGSADALVTLWTVGVGVLKSMAALALIIFFGKVGVPKVLRMVMKLKSKEILLVSVFGFVLLSAVFSYFVGLTPAIAAFVAGLVVSETAERYAVFAEIRPLRDIFSILFFVSLGLLLRLGDIIAVLPIAIGFAVLFVVLKFFVSFFLSRFSQFHPKSAFLMGLALASTSEFGFVIARGGRSYDVLSQQQYTLIVVIIVLTMVVSSILYAKAIQLYHRFHAILQGNGSHPAIPQELAKVPMTGHMILCGYGRVGSYIGRAFEMSGIPFIVVDYNHATVGKLRQKGITAIYGDPSELSVLAAADGKDAKGVVIAIPDLLSQELVIGNALTLNRHIKIFCRTHREEDQVTLKTLGVTAVIQPEFEAALSIVEKILPTYGIGEEDLSGKISRLKIEHGVG
jgi:CPA2 family monovalent cation:H+ antiporter-2